MQHDVVLTAAALGALLWPFAALGLLGLFVVLGRPLAERATGGVVATSFVLSLASTLAMDVRFLQLGQPWQELHLGTWFEVPGYTFPLTLFLDRTALVVATLAAAICGAVGRFSRSYLHREPGYTRFFLLLGLFGGGMQLLVLGGSFDLLFAGWELVGFSSALLIGFFHERDEPAQNALRAFVTYRVCDVGLLLGAILLHHHAGSAELGVFKQGSLPGGWGLTASGLLFLLAAMGKSAQFPVGGWLPRAMEGPTPSSAVFYGALSVHAGAYLLLRASPLLAQAPQAAAAVVVVGSLTAAVSTMVGRAQTDVKSSIAYATTTQVGLIFVEIGLGWTTLALVHLTSHACLRTLQLLRAPSALQDAQRVVAGAGARLPTGVRYERLLPEGLRARLYGLALARFYLDDLLVALVAAPALRLGQSLVKLERSWIDLLSGAPRPRRKAAVGATSATRSHP